MRVSWETAAKLVADELKRVRDTYGPTAIYGDSYGWMSPGAVGNARNLLQRVLNLNGGFTGGLGDYSTGCAQVILPYVIGSNGVYEQVTSWNLITDKTELIVLWGGRSHDHERHRLGDHRARKRRRLPSRESGEDPRRRRQSAQA